MVAVPYPSELEPPFRRLRGYAFDPSLGLQSATSLINEVTFKVPWESPKPARNGAAPDGSDVAYLEPGPTGEYVEVVDVDHPTGVAYAPIDLNDPLLLAQDGYPPSEGNPQFHQQMVYAVVMNTIQHFERALGRRAQWSPRFVKGRRDEARWREQFVRRLRIYPHALREANAYYSPDSKALLFGYFPMPTAESSVSYPGGIQFTCLSHDIVAHETSHALLDGLHPRYSEDTSADSGAFHEAFADLVALFQHFSHPDVLRHQIARQRGDLESQNLLGQLAQDFGRGIGSRGALREAIGEIDPATGEWRRKKPDPSLYQTQLEAHDRGGILVAAVFDAFLTIYRSRVGDLFRIASQGTGVLPPGEIHPDLVARLSSEAARAAQHVLGMCIRALDYAPPVDISFGDYLRALITADADLVPDDDLNYRVAFIEAFRRWGIYPRTVRALSVESLKWQRLLGSQRSLQVLAGTGSTLRAYMEEQTRKTSRLERYVSMRRVCRDIHKWLSRLPVADRRSLADLTGLELDATTPFARKARLETDRYGIPRSEIHAVWPARRSSPDGDVLNQLVIVITQRYWAQLDPDLPPGQVGRDNGFWFRGGCTLILDLDTLELRYGIRKSLNSASRVERMRSYLTEDSMQSLHATYFPRPVGKRAREPFALLHGRG